MPRRIVTPARAGLVALAAALAGGLYGAVSVFGNREPAACRGSAAALARLAPLAKGEVAAFQPAEKARPAPALAFDGPDGTRRTLADFRGRTILVNLWATWCEPCKREMPALDRLQGELGGPRFEVVAINLDTRNLDRPRAWLQEAGIGRLAYYADKDAKVFQDLRQASVTAGLPATLLVDGSGCTLGKLTGWAEWASPDGLALMRAALAPE